MGIRGRFSNIVFGLLLAGLITHQAHAALINFEAVDEGLYRGSRPIDNQDYQGLREKYGIRTILDLETLSIHIDPEKQAALDLFEFINIPIIPILEPNTSDVINALNVMTDPFNKPVYFHCLFGSDRTGLIAAMYRIHVQHWPPDVAEREMEQYGFKKHLLLGLYHFFEEHSAPGTL